MKTQLDTKQLLLEYSAVCGVTGMEHEAARYGADILQKFGTVQLSPLGSVICTVHPAQPGKPHLLLDAHMDEIGLVVTYIEENGFLRVANCGGINRQLLLASAVTIHAKGGDLPGVVCSVPPHLAATEADKKFKKVEQIFIDTGYEKAELEKLVQPGDRITLNSASHELLNGCVSGKALDNRAGCVVLLKTLEYLQEETLDCGLSVVLSTQEETGAAGAKTAAYAVNPTHAIVVDVSFAYMPDCPRYKCGELKKGPMVGFSPILSHKMSQKLLALAKTNEIPVQTEVMGSSTGTNCDVIATTRAGVQTALVSVPQKYMHSPIETVAVEDVENSARLIAAFAKALPKEGM